jgi:ribonuclease BN (tRNA processing enzyme)
MFNPNCEVHIWAPTGNGKNLKERLNRYLSPPLFPVHFRDLPCNMSLHEIADSQFELGPFHVRCNYICHPGPTVAFRITNGDEVVAYFPDHEPAMSDSVWKAGKDWVSGTDLAEGADILIHDSQYTDGEYSTRVGWGHCTFSDAIRFAQLAEVKKLLLFHHDPDHKDFQLEEFYFELLENHPVHFEVQLAKEGEEINVAEKRIIVE